MRILLLCDHTYRDLIGLASVQVELEHLSDHHILICDIHLFQQVTEIFKPSLVVINNLHDGARNKIVDSIRRRGGLCVVNLNEGRPNTEVQLDWLVNQWPANLCDLHLCWTEWFQSALNNRVPSVVTGCPRFDQYFRPMDAKLIKSEWGLDPDKPVITVASSFPQAKFANQGTDFLIDDWTKLGITKMEHFKNPATHAKGELADLERFSVWLSALHVEYPEFQIVLKPHPAEDVRYWQVLGDRFHIVLSDYIHRMLAVSDAHVARVGCLTIPEAWILNRPTVQCRMGNELVDGATADAVDIDEPARSATEFISYVNDELNYSEKEEEPDEYIYDKPVEEERNEYVDKYLGPMPGSSRRVAEALVKLLEEKNPKTAFDFSFQDEIQLRQLMVQHDKQYAVGGFDNIGQFSKTANLTRIDNALVTEREWYGKSNG